MEVKFENGAHLKKGLFLTYFLRFLVTREKLQKFLQHISQTHENKFIYKRNHSVDNINKFKKRLSEVKWQEILDNNDANDDYNTFIEQFDKVYDECIPLKKCTINRKKNPMSPWITKGLLKSINKKNKLYKQYIHSPTNGNLQKFKTYKNKLNILIRKSKRMYLLQNLKKPRMI